MTETREQITSEYLEARGGKQAVWDRYYSCWQYEMPDGKVLCPVLLASDFDLFRERVIEVMRDRGWYLTMASYKNSAWWWHKDGNAFNSDIIHNENLLLAAIKAATAVLKGEK